MPRYLVLLFLLIGCSAALQAAPDAELWPRWQKHDAANDTRIDHGAWGELLRTYLYRGEDGIHRFHYAGVGDAEFRRLEDYLDGLAQIEISGYNRDQQRAYWINLYNALTVREILRFYPVDSIRDISSGLFSFGPWNRKLIEIEGAAVTLNDIEHRILRPLWQDARIHYALNCASLGCPDLQLQVFTGDNSEVMLEHAARAFVNHPRGALVAGGKLQVSSIYAWFIDDFGGDDAGVIDHLRRYAGPALLDALQGIEQIDDDDYDWSLNSITDTSMARRLHDLDGS